jgi:hypothetical protein
MSRGKRLAATILTVGAVLGGFSASAIGAAPGPGDKPQCAGGPSNGNPHCPQNK